MFGSCLKRKAVCFSGETKNGIVYFTDWMMTLMPFEPFEADNPYKSLQRVDSLIFGVKHDFVFQVYELTSYNSLLGK